jgi:hypothetical protein
VPTSEPVVLHHGREGAGHGHDELRPSASTACWAALVMGTTRCAFACSWFEPLEVTRPDGALR